MKILITIAIIGSSIAIMHFFYPTGELTTFSIFIAAMLWSLAIGASIYNSRDLESLPKPFKAPPPD
jgi:hypothetical protein